MQNRMMTPLLIVAAAPVQMAMKSGYYRLRPTSPGQGVGNDSGMLVRVRSEGADLAAVLPSRDALQERLGLTMRQAEVAALLARRRSNEEIAELLFISPHTARRHTENVFLKLGVSSRLDVRHAVMEAFQDSVSASDL